jgi:hypothetical protein
VADRFVYEGNKVSVRLLTHPTDSGKKDWLSMQQSLNTLNAKLEKLEERFTFGEIDREIFVKVGGKLKQEIKALNDELRRSGIELSNPALLIDHSLEIISNGFGFVVMMMTSASFRKSSFQRGVLFDKQFNNYRTREVELHSPVNPLNIK